MLFNKNPSLFKNFLTIWLCHLIMDFQLGIWPAFKILAGLDLAKAGLIAGLSMLIGESCQLFFGYLSDQGHSKKLATAGLVLAGSISLAAYTSNYYLLFVIMLGTYLGSSSFHPAAIGMVGSWSEKRKGFFVALFASGGMIGSAFSQGIFSKSFVLFNGHTLIFLFPVLCLGIYFYFHPFPPPKRRDIKVNLRELLEAIRPHKFELGKLYLMQVGMQSIILSFIFLLPDVLHFREYEEWFCLGGGHFCFVMGSALMSVPMGHFSDRYTHRSVLIVVILASLLTFYFFLLAGPLSNLYTGILLFILGGSMGVIHPIIVAAGNGLVPPHTSSFVSALLMGGASCLGSLGIIAAGNMAALITYVPPISALEVMGFMYLIIVFLLFQLKEKGSDEKNVFGKQKQITCMIT